MAVFIAGLHAGTACAQSANQPVPKLLKILLEVNGRYPLNDGLGKSVLGLGDINRDGWPDVAVGAWGREQTLIYFGGPGILDDREDVVLGGGEAMVSGDFNGDGSRDLIVHYDSYPDSVFVYFGKASGPLAIDTVPGIVIVSPSLPSGCSGFARLMLMGDLNADGFDDLVIRSSATLDTSLHNSGALHLYLGRLQPRATADFIGSIQVPHASYAETVCMGDVNGDGVPDLVLTTMAEGPIPATMDDDSVLVDVHFGRPGWTLDAEYPDRRYRDAHFHGPTIGRVRYPSLIDANADGSQDFYVSCGDSVYIYYGGPGHFSSEPDRILPTPASVFDGFFNGACGIGDITGDGYDDFALRLGAGKTLYLVVYPGYANGIGFDRAAVAYKDGSLSALGSPGACAPVGDMNGDGVNDFAAGAAYGEYGLNMGYFAVYSGDTTLHPTGVAGLPTQPTAPSLAPSHPNPFVTSTMVTFTAGDGGTVRLVVRDMLGRHVRTLFTGPAPSGATHVEWDGRDDAAVPVPPGPYLLALTTPATLRCRMAVRLVR